MVWQPSSPKKISHPHAICSISGRGLPFACCTAERCNRLFQGYTRSRPLGCPRLEPEGHRQDWHPHVTWAVGIKLHILQGDPPGAKWILWLRHIGRVPWFFAKGATGHCAQPLCQRVCDHQVSWRPKHLYIQAFGRYANHCDIYLCSPAAARISESTAPQIIKSI